MKDKTDKYDGDEALLEHYEEWDDWGEEHPKAHARSKARTRLKTDDRDAVREAEEALGPPREGLVVLVGSKFCDVLAGDETVRCGLKDDLAADQRARVAPGDEVVFRARPQGRPLVESVAPRRSQLSRPDPLNPRVERVLAANVDRVILVLGVVAPPLKVGLADRVIMAVRRGGAAPAIFINKCDLLAGAENREEEEAAAALVEVHRDHGVPVLRGSAATGAGVEALRELLRDQAVVFVGHSGVGKTSLLNALHPGLDLAVGEVRERDGLGRHTTTQARVIPLGGGTRLIDTPGVRQFGLWDVDPRELAARFPEFAGRAGCRFGDCSHRAEPACVIRAAVEAGEIPRDRYGVYLDLLDSLQPG